MSKIRIRCKVLPGNFDSEYYVLVNGSTAYYINKKNVQVGKKTPTAGNPVDGTVTAYVVEKSGSKLLVQLPGEPALGGLRTWVKKADIAA